MKNTLKIFLTLGIFIPAFAGAQELSTPEPDLVKMSLDYGLGILIILGFAFGGWWVSNKIKEQTNKYKQKVIKKIDWEEKDHQNDHF